ncbi:hypothetical protein L3Q82_008455, partial [Scortum barcoo]
IRVSISARGTRTLTLGRRSMIDFVVVSSDLRPYILDTRVKRGAELSTDHHLVVSWLQLAEEEVGQTWQTQTSEVVDARSLVPVVVAIPEPVVVDTGSKGCRQAEEGVLSDHVGLWDSWTRVDRYRQAKQKPQPRAVLEAKTRVWEEFGEAMEEDYRSASKRFWQTVRRLRRGKQYSANTVYSAGGELLTSTEDISRTVEEILRGSPQSHQLAFQ